MGKRGADDSIEARVSLARNRSTSADTLYELAADPSARVRHAVASRPDAPATALRPLTRDRDRDVREAVARNPAASQGNLLRLVGDADRWVRWAVAANPSCDERIRGVMAKAQDKELRGLVAEMWALEPELAALLIEDVSPEVRERLAAHTYDQDVIATLLKDRTVRVRKGLATNERTTAEQRHTLAQDPSPDVRATLVRALQLDEADLRSMLDDRSADVRRAMATSDLVAPHIREALENDPDESVADDARHYRGGTRTTAKPAAAPAGGPQTTAKPAAAPTGGHRRALGKRFPGKAAG